jgi:hypothetical protein
MTPAQYEQYFTAAEGLASIVFADPALRGRILTCASGDACVRQIVRAFGRRAWRRPLQDAEVERLARLAGEATAAGEDFTGSIRHVVATMLASMPFLYRIELDPRPDQTQPHPLDAHELASRLSYFLWSTMPDDTLLDLAGAGQLDTDAALDAQLARMLGDARASRFVSGFAGQWLGLRDLASHQVEAGVFPDWDEPLRKAMIAEGTLFFREFLDGGRGVGEFFTAPVSFVDARLARHYKLSVKAATDPVRVENPMSERPGFLGTGAFLTTTSFSYRTSPTLRGVWIHSTLLCTSVPQPPAMVPELDQPGSATASATQNVRDRLAQHRSNAACASCHALFDPIGLGLETFDAIGRARTRYPNGDTIDPSGTMPDGATFRGLRDLAGLLARDERFPDCLERKLFVYAHGRELGAGDEPFLAQMRTAWRAEGLGLRSLLKQMVLSPTFRSRRGEGAL